MGFNHRRNSGSQFSGFIIAAVIVGALYFLFYKKDEAPVSNQNLPAENLSSRSQPNALENYEREDVQRKQALQQNAKPFLSNVILRYADDGSAKGPMHLTSSAKKDAVFIIRNKLNNVIMAIVQVPRNSTQKIQMPVGEYSIEYAEGEGMWQGLGEFWGYGTQFNKSRLEHRVYQEFIPNGTRTHGTGIILDVPEGTAPESISKRQFVSD